MEERPLELERSGNKDWGIEWVTHLHVELAQHENRSWNGGEDGGPGAEVLTVRAKWTKGSQRTPLKSGVREGRPVGQYEP